MDIWYTENHTDNVRLSIRIDRQLASVQSEFQRIDVFDSVEFGRIMTLDGLLMVTEKDEYIYHEMITHIPMATNPSIKKVLVIGAGDGGTVRELCRYPSIEQIDMVEIDELVVQRVSAVYSMQSGRSAGTYLLSGRPAVCPQGGKRIRPDYCGFY